MPNKIFARTLILLLTLSVLLSTFTVCVNADASTTTFSTCFKDDSPNTAIYVYTDEPYSDYKYYGAKYEPNGGAYFGRTTNAGALSGGGWGNRNTSDIKECSAFSTYTSLEDEYGLAHWSYLFNSFVWNGKHAMLINLNFDKEGDNCSEVIRGDYDTTLKANFNYIGNFTFPVFMRIGGEVNVWTTAAEPSEYIAAYRHIANLAHTYASNVALVFSPSSSSSYLTDMDDYYPGDAYVDWIGTSLYYNRYADNGDTERDEFYGVNDYGDAVLCMQQIINLSNLHKKPVIITEGGSAWLNTGVNTYSYAKERMDRALSFLTMKYPQIKCVIYSDNNFGSSTNKYEIFNDSTLNSTYKSAAAENLNFKKTQSEKRGYYTNLKSYDSYFEPRLYVFSAYTHDVDHPSARWFLDGTEILKTSDYPYYCQIDFSKLNSGRHTIEVLFSNGELQSSYVWNFSEEQMKDVRNRFSDIDDDAWYVDSMQQAYDMGLMKGTTRTAIEPNTVTTRAMFVQILYNMAGQPTVEKRQFFDDVPKGQWYSDALNWAYLNGIVSGTGLNKFSPNDAVTREQVTVILRNYQKNPAATADISGFADSEDVSSWALDAVIWAVEKKIINGSKVGKTLYLKPQKSATRAEIAAITVSYAKLSK